MEPELPIGPDEIAHYAGILVMVGLGLLLGFFILKFCQYRQDEIPKLTHAPPPLRQLYRHPPTPVEDDGWYFGFGRRDGANRPELTTAMTAIYYNQDLTEVIVTNPHVFILFCLPAEFCPFSGPFLTLLVEAAEELKRSPGDGVSRVVVAANCSSDPSMASKHNVHQYPTLSYFRDAIYYCDYTGDRTAPALISFMATVVTHEFDPSY